MYGFDWVDGPELCTNGLEGLIRAKVQKINPRGPPLRHRRHHAKFRLRSPFGTPADAKFLRIVPNSFGSATPLAKFSKIIFNLRFFGAKIDYFSM